MKRIWEQHLREVEAGTTPLSAGRGDLQNLGTSIAKIVPPRHGIGESLPQAFDHHEDKQAMIAMLKKINILTEKTPDWEYREDTILFKLQQGLSGATLKMGNDPKKGFYYSIDFSGRLQPTDLRALRILLEENGAKAEPAGNFLRIFPGSKDDPMDEVLDTIIRSGGKFRSR